MTQLFSNNATTDLDGAITTGMAVITVTDGSVFQSPTGGDFELATLFNGVDIDSSTNVEIVKITARSANQLTVTRAQEGTSAFAFGDAAGIVAAVTAATLVQFQTDVSNVGSGVTPITKLVSDASLTFDIDNDASSADQALIITKDNGGTELLRIDETGLLTMTGALTCGVLTSAAFTCTSLTSNGIDDNATAERLQLADTALTLGASGVSYSVLHAVDNLQISLSGGSASNLGGNVILYGSTHATQADDIEFRGSAVTQLLYDDSASTWDFQANDIITTGALTCAAFTSTGIDDNATGERLQVADTVMDLGTSGASYEVVHSADDQFLTFSGGSAASTGSNIQLFGSTHATLANDIRLRAGSTLQLIYDDSASTWDFQANDIITTGDLFTAGGASVGYTSLDQVVVGDTVGSTGIVIQGATTGQAALTFGDGALAGRILYDFTLDDLSIVATGATQLLYDDSASAWDFQLNQVILDQGTADNGFINFQATIDADATSAISSLTTSGATTHHIQVQINGTTAWVAVSTTDPS